MYTKVDLNCTEKSGGCHKKGIRDIMSSTLEQLKTGKNDCMDYKEMMRLNFASNLEKLSDVMMIAAAAVIIAERMLKQQMVS